MLILSSTGRAWESAFHGALDFLEREPDGKLLLGPKIGKAGQSWITKALLDKNAQVFGKRILPWQDWLKDQARETAFELGESFVQLNAAAERDLFREVLNLGRASNLFYHIDKLLHDEQFFNALLDTTKELRKAGLVEGAAIGRAQEILRSRTEDLIYRQVYDDLWHLLKLFQVRIDTQGRFDEASTVAKAASGMVNETALYLLGFEHFSALEIDLIQKAARNVPVHVPLPLTAEELTKPRSEDPETLAAGTVQGLLTGFAGELRIESAPSGATDHAQFVLLHAHTPEAEARVAAEYCRWKGGKVSLVASPHDFVKVEPEFLHALQIQHPLVHKAAADHSVVRLVLHVFQLKEEKYPLALGVELAELFAALTGEFANVPEVALRAGVRKGIADWRRDPALEPFADRLLAIGEKIPERGRAGVFKGALDHVLEELHFAKLAHSETAPSDREERETHVALAALIRNAQMLASATTTEFTLAEWLSEISALLNSSALDTECELEGLRFHGLGEWVPPGAQPLVLGLSAGCEPRIHFNFYLEERVRRQLGEFRLRTQLQMEMQFVDYLERLRNSGAIFSRSTHGSDGKELTQAWPLSGFAPEIMEWPEVPPAQSIRTPSTDRAVKIERGVRVEKFSASYFEQYKECPFKVYVKKVLRLEDKAQDAKLDISYIDEGSLFHRALEIYYAGGGKDLRSAEERRSSIVAAMDRAAGEKKLEFYNGNETLLEIQVDRLKRILVDFVETDAEYYAQFPTLGVPKTEVAVQGELAPGVAYSGKIDRVDMDEENKKLLVVDYKSGAALPGSKEIQSLERFQLPLYLEAAEKAFPGYTGVGGYYVSLKSGLRNQGMIVAEHVTSSAKAPKPGEVKYIKLGGASAAKMPTEKFFELRQQAKTEMLRLAGSIRAGDFSITPLDEATCNSCEVRPVCRVREIQAPLKAELPRQDLATAFAKIQNLKPGASGEKPKREPRFNDRQKDALARRGQMVFIEASAGTGKTTVIVEKIRSFLAERIALEPSHKAVERFLAISFTEKSTQELSERLSKVLLEQYGAKVAAQAIAQVQTIHGFCRRVINDFPIEAGTSPLARMLGQWEIEALKAEALDELFLHPSKEGRDALARLYDEYSRRKIAQVLHGLIDKRLLLRDDLDAYKKLLLDLTASGPGVFPEDEPHRCVAAAFFTLLDEFGTVYKQKKDERVALDFNDLEELALTALAVPAVKEYYRNRLHLVLVDEFQDTNSVQRGILDGLAADGGRNFFFVGDAKQSIYRFRNADVAVFTELRKRAANEGSLITLTENYRSKNELVAVFNKISKTIFPDDTGLMPFEAPHAEAEATQGEGGRCVVYKYKLEKATAAERREFEAKQVANLVRERISGGAKSVALLLRKVTGNEVFLKALNEAGIRYRIGSSGGFYEQQVVLDGIAFLRAVVSGTSEMALLAVLRSPWVGMQDQTIVELFQGKRGADRFHSVPFLAEWRKKAQHLACSQLLRSAFHAYPLGPYEVYQVEKLCQTVLSLEAEGHSKFAIIRLLSSWSGWEREDEALNEPTMPEPAAEHGVHVLTVHAAKGLEFDVTILADLDAKAPNDLSPLRILPGIGFGLKTENDEDAPAAYTEMGTRNSERDLAESKRLFYVAVTRAKRELVIVLQDQERDKKETWADFVRASSLGELVDWKLCGGEGAAEPSKPALSAKPEKKRALDFPHAISRGFSVSELAAFHFCPEFHRKKFVQRWDDLVIDLWPKEKVRKAPKGHDELGLVLKALGVQRKERGIALHRVLERIKCAKEELGKAEEWLKEAYEAQGVNMDHEKLPRLIGMDLKVLTKFLGSPFARAVFSPRIDAYPEIPFSWKSGSVVVHGTIDRMVIDKQNATTVVLDYKSSLHEETRARYELQLHCYLLATEQFLKAKKIGGEISGFLVDLNTGEEHPVPFKSLEAWAVVEELVAAVMENYTLASEKQCIARFQVKEKPECLTCAYSMHCEIGRKYM